MTLKIYKKKLDYSYAFGTYPVIEMLKKIPDKVITVLISDQHQDYEGIELIKSLCKKNNINYDVSTHTIRKLAVKENTIVIGVFKKYTNKLHIGEDHVLLDQPSDMGNVGTIIRTMIGFGIFNLGLIRPAVDILDPKVVRTSMGSIFDLKFEYYDSLSKYQEQHKQNKLYSFILNGKSNLSDLKFTNPATLIFGNEGRGLDKQYEKFESVKISHLNTIDSLNLSIAAGIALHHLFTFK